MDQLKQLFSELAFYYIIAAALVIAGLSVLHFLVFRRKKIFQKLLKEAAESRSSIQLLEKYSFEYLCRKSRGITEISRTSDFNLPDLLHLGTFWIDQFSRSGSMQNLDWILEFIPETGLFTVFEKALNNKKVADRLVLYINESKDLLILRKIALSSRGKDFDGDKAMVLFQDRMDEIREMTGDPEWAARYFAIKILLHDGDPRSDRSVWESLDDSHALVRATVVREIDKDAKPYDAKEISTSGSFLFDDMKSHLLNDPSLEVRKASKERIMKDFHSFYSWKNENFKTEQSLHILQLLEKDSEEDRDFAMKNLETDNLELRQSAAIFLQNCGILSRLFKESHLSDQKGLERNFTLLKHAEDVNVTRFLYDVEKVDNPGTLLIASRLLKGITNQKALLALAIKVFKLSQDQKKDADFIEIYRNTLECISLHGNDDALILLIEEMDSVKGDSVLMAGALQWIPERSSFIALPQLEIYLKDQDFELKDDLRAALLKMPQPEVLEIVLDIINKGRTAYSHPVRIQALKILGEMKKEYCLQTILENLSILPLEEGKEFAKMLSSSYAEKLFDERVEAILNSVDAQSRASLIVCLPATEKKTFLKKIQEGLADANPEVRIACIWALVDYKDTKQLNKSAAMLRDPVENVRLEAAKALGSFGSDAVLQKLDLQLNDENEVISVKRAAIIGLSRSVNPKSVEILVQKIDKDGELKFECIEGLSKKRDKKCLTILVEQFKDAGPQLRDDISRSVEMMGIDGERLMVELLKEDIPSLYHYIADVLESSGYVESNIRKLKHRDPRVRKEAADFLSAVRTKAAFRGIVLAARDPNQEVRISVSKALEALNTAEGTAILKELEQDPDRKVRKYTLWALERIKTKGL
ncbi:MAG: hypothetical protein B6241_11395 [Spirochaetaceae bacterium 4572_59]|nr:MAG: hypothetical protein B6241_11395 [Spirochaetaceae bacterium 4572_59]